MVIQFKAILLFQFIHLFLLKLYDIILVSYLCWPILSDRQEKRKCEKQKQANASEHIGEINPK